MPPPPKGLGTFAARVPLDVNDQQQQPTSTGIPLQRRTYVGNGPVIQQATDENKKELVDSSTTPSATEIEKSITKPKQKPDLSKFKVTVEFPPPKRRTDATSTNTTNISSNTLPLPPPPPPPPQPVPASTIVPNALPTISRLLTPPSPTSPIRSPAPYPPPQAPKTVFATSKQPQPQQHQRNRIITIESVEYEILHSIGKGGSSTVYCALRRAAATTNQNQATLVALKHVQGKENVASLNDEINVLTKLAGVSSVAQLFAHDVNEEIGYMVMELGSLDLSQYLIEHGKTASTPLPSRNLMKYLWESMLNAVSLIHGARVVHGDLKPANFVFVRGVLKVIDFGIAKGIRDDTVNITRDSQTGTVNYIPPEALLPNAGSDSQYKLSIKADIWSLGCILYMLVYGSPPFQQVVPLARKITAIISPSHVIKFPNTTTTTPTAPPIDPAVIDVMQRCLQRDPTSRPTTGVLLAHPYLTGSSSATPKGVATLVECMARRSDLVAGLCAGNSNVSGAKVLSKLVVHNLTTTSNVEVALEDALKRMVVSSSQSTEKPHGKMNDVDKENIVA